MKADIVIIGGGVGGYTAAIKASQGGAKVVIVEERELGGTCLNRGCIPTKTLVASASLLRKIKEAKNFGIEVGEARPNMMKILQRKEKVVSILRRGVESLMKKNKIEVVQGRARICEPGRVEIEGRGKNIYITCKHIIVATGSQEKTLFDLEFDGNRILSSTHLLNLSSIPHSMIIIGGGVIGCEFAYILTALGCKVKIIEALDRLLPIDSVDKMCSNLLLREFKKEKIDIYLKARVEEINLKEEKVEVSFSQQNQKSPSKIEAEKVAICVGRSPIMEKEEIESLSLETYGGGWLEVDKNFQTSIDGIYAIGDCLGPKRPMLAHVASHEASAVISTLLGEPREMDYSLVPSVIYTEPEIGCVGLTEEGAKDRGISYDVSSVLFRGIGRSHTTGEISGEAKLIFDTQDKKVLGIQIIGAHASELVATGTVLLQKGATLEDIEKTIFAHPTLSEIFHEIALKGMGQALHG